MSLNEAQRARVTVLRDRLSQRDVTPDEVREYCWYVHKPTADRVGVHLDLNAFVDEQQLVAFWWLHDYWEPIPNKPVTLPTPNLEQFTFYCTTMPITTLQMGVERTYQDMVRFMQENNINVANPAEDKETRRKRLNAERMAAVRANRRVPNAKVDETMRPAVRALEEQRDKLKDEFKQEDERLAARVRELQQAMMAAANSRKEAKLDFQKELDVLNSQIQALVGKS